MTKREQKIISLYGGGGWVSVFTKIRFWDAPYLLVESLTDRKGKIIDLGCGYGMFANFLALCSKKRQVLGIELNHKKIIHADKRIKNAKFIEGDIRDKSIPRGDNIILMHVLHHLGSFKQQDDLLKACLEKLNKNGKIIVIECVMKPKLLFFLTRIADTLMYPGDRIYYRDVNDWGKLFRKLSVNYKTIPAHSGKPFSHVIFEIRR